MFYDQILHTNFSDMNIMILRKLEVIEATMGADIKRLKAVLIRKIHNDAAEKLFENKKCTTENDFETFCQKLQTDKEYQDVYVSWNMDDFATLYLDIFAIHVFI